MTLHNFEYLIVLILVISIPLILSFLKKSYVYGQRKSLWLAIFTVAPFWIIYDIWATERGHWSFNPDYNLNINIVNLPLEEILFFVCVPFSCLFVWTIFRDFTTLKDFINRLKPTK